jgi:hypothetical protein
MRYLSIKTPPPPSSSFLPRVYALQKMALINPDKVFQANCKLVERRF